LFKKEHKNLRRHLILFLICWLCPFSLNAQWVIQQSGTTNTLLDIHFVSSNNGVAVGTSGQIVRTSNAGANWLLSQYPVPVNMWAVYMLNSSTGFAGGDGTIGKTTNGGLSFTFLSPGISSSFRGMFFIDVNTGFASGNNGVIVKTINGGNNWTTLTTGTTEWLYELQFSGVNTGFAAGSAGKIIKTTDGGSNWELLTSGITTDLYGLWVINSDTVFAVGAGGKILKTFNGGSNWVSVTSGTTNRLNKIQFSNPLTGTISGFSGTILRTTNGGISWIPQQSGTTGQSFYSLSFTSADTGTIVGSSGYILHTTTGGFSPPSPPGLLAPSNGQTNVPVNPAMDWDSTSWVFTYSIQIAEDSLFTNLSLDTSGLIISGINLPAGILINNKTYYWRVRGFNMVGFGQWSQSWNFTTIVAIPNAPALLLPVNNASNVDLNPFFDWDSTSPALYYRLQVSSDSLFNLIDADVTGITVSALTLTTDTLSNNTRYYWRVNAANFAGTGNWSVPSRFTTEISIPPAPVLYLPPNNSNNVSLTPTFIWREDISATGYRVQVSRNPAFSSFILDTNNIPNPYYTVPNDTLQNFTKYYWRVRTTNNLGTGEWSEIWNFTTILSIPAAPVLLLPPNNSVNVSLTPLLDWDDNAYSTYRLQVSTDSSFSTTLLNIGLLTASQYQVQGGTFANNVTYYWRVNATNTAGTGPWSQIWHFTTIVSAPVAAPILQSPTNGSVGISGTPLLNWNDVFGAQYYRVQVSTDSLFGSSNLDSTLTFSHITVPAGILTSNVRYYWRARASNAGGIGPWSETWNFTTGAIGINIISSNIPKEFKLYNNYPNPFNPYTKIRFDVPKPTQARLTIYDLLGREMTEIFNLNIQPGTYEVTWNAANYASGVYLYRLVTEENTDIKKMVLVK
jgi:photosystem II stability/assembly factor-like uncharacterized protein